MMSKAHRFLFLYVPLMAFLLFVSLMAVPRTTFIPWEHLNVWTVIKAFVLSYMLIGAIALMAKLRQLGLHLVLAAVTLGFFAVALCWLSFGSFYYIVSWSHTPAFFAISAALLLAGVHVILRCRREERMRASKACEPDSER